MAQSSIVLPKPQDIPADALTFREDITGNTHLHQLILAGDTEKAIALIQHDQKAEIINVKALENTALILALKRGLFRVAMALLQHPKIDVYAKDKRGLRAIDVACILKENNIIEALLAIEKEKDILFGYTLQRNLRGVILQQVPVYDAILKRDGFCVPIEFVTPFQLYVSRFKDYNVKQILKNYIDSTFVSDSFTEGAKDTCKHICLECPVVDAATDLFVFHSRALSVNLGLKKISDYKNESTSNTQHKEDLKLSGDIICDASDKVVLSPTIAKRLFESSFSNFPLESNLVFVEDYSEFTKKVVANQNPLLVTPLMRLALHGNPSITVAASSSAAGTLADVVTPGK